MKCQRRACLREGASTRMTPCGDVRSAVDQQVNGFAYIAGLQELTPCNESEKNKRLQKCFPLRDVHEMFMSYMNYLVTAGLDY